jgi:hypothetical protein
VYCLFDLGGISTFLTLRVSLELAEHDTHDRESVDVNGRSKFSASSMVVMKNSIRFSIFAETADDRYARLPNFLLMDNIEDKGMQKGRSQNFQRQMVEVSKTIKNDF